MPISKLQRAILNVIAANRSPESVVHGGSVLNRSGLRYSDDIDIAHGLADIVAETAQTDATSLIEAGYDFTWTRRGIGHFAAEISGGGDKTKLEWSHDSDFRFFPAMRDDEFGYVLHPVDIATNKVLAAADRRVVRDAVDLMTVHKAILPLGAAVWAAVAKQVGFTPEGLLAEISKNLNTFTAGDFATLAVSEPLDAKAFVLGMKAIFAEANAFVRVMPPGTEGQLFLLDGKPVQPDPDKLDSYTTHEAQRRGHWPTSPEISSSMLNRRPEGGAQF